MLSQAVVWMTCLSFIQQFSSISHGANWPLIKMTHIDISICAVLCTCVRVCARTRAFVLLCVCALMYKKKNK